MRHPVSGRSETEKALPSGSYWVMPGGVKHVSECLPGGACVALIVQDGQFDFLPVQGQ